MGTKRKKQSVFPVEQSYGWSAMKNLVRSSDIKTRRLWRQSVVTDAASLEVVRKMNPKTKLKDDELGSDRAWPSDFNSYWPN